MGNVEQQLGNFQKALELHGQALDIQLQTLGGGHVAVADTYCNMGVVYKKLGNFEKALEMYEKDLEITIKSLGVQHASVAMTKGNMGYVYEQLGNLAQAQSRWCNEAHFLSALFVRVILQRPNISSYREI